MSQVKNEMDAFATTGGLASNVVSNAMTYTAEAAGAVDIFTVTGDVIVKVLAICTTSLADAAGGGTVSVGIAGDTAGIIPVTTMTDIDARDIWHDNTPDSELESLDVLRSYVISDGNDIILTVAVQDIDSGAITYTCYWTPITTGATVVAA